MSVLYNDESIKQPCRISALVFGTLNSAMSKEQNSNLITGRTVDREVLNIFAGCRKL